MGLMKTVIAPAVVTLAGLGGTPALAEYDVPVVSIELSQAQPSGDACLMSFVAQNRHGSDIAQAVYEVVLFDAAGQVAELTLLDFQDLPAGRPRVRQFQFAHACDQIGSVLFNGAATCDGADLSDQACSKGLTLRSRTKQELLG